MSVNLLHYKQLKDQLPKDVSLCIISKHHPKEDILRYYELGERRFGENRVQELTKKLDLPKDIEWHFIGHLQTNKVKQVIPYVSCVQSVDSIKLAKEIDQECKKINKVMPIYAQFHLAIEDENKYGLKIEEASSFFEECKDLSNINLCGMMVMGPHTDNQERIKEVFNQAKQLFQTLQKDYPNLTTLSMGMSDDYPIAIQCGSTMVRIGSYLFEGDE